MTESGLQQIFDDPSLLAQVELDELIEYSDDFPFSAIPSMLAAKKARQSNDARFETLLARAAALVSSRQELKRFIDSEIKTEIESSEKTTLQIDESIPDIAELEQNYSAEIDYQSLLEEEINELDDFDIQKQIEKTRAAHSVDVEVPKNTSPLNEANKTGMHTFADWFDHLSDVAGADMLEEGPAGRDSMEVEDSPVVEPPIKAVEEEDVKDIASRSLKKNESYYTETLALVYAAQKKYEAAIVVYRHLQLKYPEKSTYFAARIEELKET